MTNIELYEALKPRIGEEGAKLLAETLPRFEELATKADLAELKAEMRGWMLAFFVPLWIGVYATLGALVISILVAR